MGGPEEEVEGVGWEAEAEAGRFPPVVVEGAGDVAGRTGRLPLALGLPPPSIGSMSQGGRHGLCSNTAHRTVYSGNDPVNAH